MHVAYSLPADLAPFREGRIDHAQLHEVEHHDLPAAQRRFAPVPELLRVAEEIIVEDPTKADEVEHVIGLELKRRADARRPRPMLVADMVEPFPARA